MLDGHLISLVGGKTGGLKSDIAETRLSVTMISSTLILDRVLLLGLVWMLGVRVNLVIFHKTTGKI